MSEQTPIEAARAWSEARGLSVEWRDDEAPSCYLSPAVRIDVDTCGAGFAATVWLDVIGEWEAVHYSFEQPTPTAALDAAADQAARLCGALAKLGGTYHPASCQCEGCLLGYCQTQQE